MIIRYLHMMNFIHLEHETCTLHMKKLIQCNQLKEIAKASFCLLNSITNLWEELAIQINNINFLIHYFISYRQLHIILVNVHSFSFRKICFFINKYTIYYLNKLVKCDNNPIISLFSSCQFNIYIKNSILQFYQFLSIKQNWL